MIYGNDIEAWYTRHLLYHDLLKRQALGTVEQIDDAAILEPTLLQRSLHGGVAPVGVDADVVGAAETVVEHVAHHAMNGLST